MQSSFQAKDLGFEAAFGFPLLRARQQKSNLAVA
jgi:hypothetical protein